ncbi:unnamed protein product [Periconia digitata]|uniref:Uncharacterized protein n=1 Tax=Periconia digitata TaxID=1303443 RepID=A0A9W4UGU8_9PLEO|nr:unnamed protein product [Periconia digitata]
MIRTVATRPNQIDYRAVERRFVPPLPITRIDRELRCLFLPSINFMLAVIKNKSSVLDGLVPLTWAFANINHRLQPCVTTTFQRPLRCDIHRTNIISQMVASWPFTEKNGQ